MPAAVSIHCCERTAKPVERQSERRTLPHRADERAHRLALRRHDFEPSHQHVEQPLARLFFRHVGHVLRQHGAVDGFEIGRKNRQRGRKLVAQLRKRHPGGLGDVGEADLFKTLFGKERHESGDDLVARRLRRGGIGGGGMSHRLRRRFASGSTGHDWTPKKIELQNMPISGGASNGR